MKSRAILLFVSLGYAAAAGATPQLDDAALRKIVDDARFGRIELCRDPRWPSWRFDQGEAGRVRLTALRKLADAAWRERRDTKRGEPYAAAREASRLFALASVVGGASDATDRVAWHATFDEIARFVESWRTKAHAIGGNDFAAAAARRSVWRMAHARAYARQPPSEVFTGIGECLLSAHSVTAEQAALRFTLAALEQGRWPSDGGDGKGAETDAIAAVRTAIGLRYISENWRRLSDGAARGRLPPGILPLWRIYVKPDPAPVSTLPPFLARFEAEWASIDALFRSASPAATIGEELFRRTRPEQYGRLSLSAASVQFSAGPQLNEARAAIWKKTSETDVANTQRVKQLLATRVWFDDEVDGDGAETFGWLIVQHADLDPDFQREVLRRLEPLLAEGRVRPRDYAFLWDRVAVADKRPQRYGTQFTCKDGAWVTTGGVEDPEQLDARRAKLGLGPWRDDLAGIERSHGKCAS